ncbi:MAG: helix-turn-helix domain-containing protein [Candidatus Peribacteria bacterium]|nr:helix-turn-helix domain-containing protein [Candidatus Peribacteria bacterium]
MKERPSFYAILPANIRYAEDLSEFQKLLYAEITALATKEGYCFASNSYFAELYGKCDNRISKMVSDLAKK